MKMNKKSKIYKRMNRPHRLDTMNNGYEKIFKFLERGCKVTSA